jgi:3-hydroxyacyl-[acyl-carrier-protein] dehydratase
MNIDYNTNKLKKQLLFGPDVRNDLIAPINQESIKNIIPHREPFLFVDSIELINLEQRLIKTTRWIDPKDPVFNGHFPDNPIYPGALQQEIIFESCLVLLYFLVNNTTQAPKTYSVINAVGTKVHDYNLLSSIVPNDTLSVYCCIPEYDAFLSTGIGQICVKDKICSFGKGDFYVT